MHWVKELCYIVIILIVNFLIFIHFTNHITLKQSLAQKLNLIFKFSSIMRLINIPLWNHMGQKRWTKDQKSFARCYTIALKFWDEFDSNFAWLYVASYRSLKIWHFHLKNEKKNNKVVHLRLFLIYPHQNLSNIKKHLAFVLK